MSQFQHLLQTDKGSVQAQKRSKEVSRPPAALVLLGEDILEMAEKKLFFFFTLVRESIVSNEVAMTMLASCLNPEHAFDPPVPNTKRLLETL